MITKWLEEQNIDILGPWPGNSPDLNPIENLLSILKGWVDKASEADALSIRPQGPFTGQIRGIYTA